ncbi:MAG: dehydratase medium subunit [Clostridia bacterium]|jgi:hypothetical protein|nr:dehydratase medium subunit [Clostridia bacterium]
MDEKLIADIVKQILLSQELDGHKNLTPSSNSYQSPKEVGIGIGAAYGIKIHYTINGLPVDKVLKEIMAGIEEEGMIPKVYRIMRTSDVSFMGNDVAKLAGSGIGIGLQSKGTAVIHQKDLYPLTNLELFPQAPLLTLETYRQIGKNAAKYAKGEQVMPVPIQNDPMCRPKFQVKAALMHTIETELVVDRGEPIPVTTNM